MVNDDRSCASCRYWDCYSEDLGPWGSCGDDDTYGYCRRHAPRAEARPAFPSTGMRDWCGDWVPDTPLHANDLDPEHDARTAQQSRDRQERLVAASYGEHAPPLSCAEMREMVRIRDEELRRDIVYSQDLIDEASGD